jgi:hypothetical protein
MMAHIAWFVEHVYPFLVPIVIVVATFVLTLKRERALVVPFIIALLLLFAVFYVTNLYAIFFLSLPSMFVTLWIPVLLAAYLSYAIRWALRRLGLAR